MTDNETIEGLVCCADTATRCDECPYYGKETMAVTCSMFLMQDACKLIKNQKEMVYTLSKDVQDLIAERERHLAEIERLQKDQQALIERILEQ